VDRPEDARTIQVDQSRALKEDAVVFPNEAAVKVYIIHHADAMDERAQNALLKLWRSRPKAPGLSW
jgi:DNA polymerase III gamma/tau subunit